MLKKRIRKVLIELVIKSHLQLLVQSILVYVVLGPGEEGDSSTAGEDIVTEVTSMGEDSLRHLNLKIFRPL